MAIELIVPLYGWFGQVAGVDQQQLILRVILLHGVYDSFLSGQTAHLVTVSTAKIEIAVNAPDIDDVQGFRLLVCGGRPQLMTESEDTCCDQQPGT